MAPSRCRDIQGCSCQQFVLWLEQGATMETLGGKEKTGGLGEPGGEKQGVGKYRKGQQPPPQRRRARAMGNTRPGDRVPRC